MKRFLLVFIIGLVCSLPIQRIQGAEEIVNGAGATFPYPIYASWAYMYHEAAKIKVNYQAIGSGGGQRQIVDRTIDFGASDDPLNPQLLQKYKLLQFPMIIGGVVPVVNIEGVKSGDLLLDGDTLGSIYLGKITYWDDEKIKKLNPDVKLPHAQISVIFRAESSGTTALFTKFLSEANFEWSDVVGNGKAVKFPVGLGGRGNQGVTHFVKTLPNCIGYVEFTYAMQNKLTTTKLKNFDGNPVEPNFNSFLAAANIENFDAKADFYTSLVNAKGKDVWPIAGASYILLAADKPESNKKSIQFFQWALKNGKEKARELFYVPLPDELQKKVEAYWKAKGLITE